MPGQKPPARFFAGAGAGHGQTELLAFDRALAAAGMSEFNLVRVSSIIPPGAARAGEVDLPPGLLLPVAYGSFSSSEEGQVISAAVAAGIPESPGAVGIIMEFAGPLPEQEARQAAEEMARQALVNRGSRVKEVIVVSAEAVVRGPTAVFAGVALLP